MAWEHGYRHVLLEVDSKVVVDMLTKTNGVKGYNGVSIERCLKLINKEWIVKITHVYREANIATD